MSTVSIQEAQANLPELIHRLSPGDEMVITENNEPVARILPATSVATVQPKRTLGTLKDTVLHMSPDFDAPMHDFEEYTE